MTTDQASQFDDLEKEFRLEQKGYGSLALHFTADSPSKDAGGYVGYDLHPENIEALYFEGIGVPRWETIKADTVEDQTAQYMEKYNAAMAEYPMISRCSDTDAQVRYGSEEVNALLEEGSRILGQTSDAKAVRAAQKLSLAANRAIEKQIGLDFIPRM
jgi:hypothetical protein